MPGRREPAAGPTGRLDVLVNSAGLFRTAPALELSRADFEAILATNVTGAFVLAQAAGRVMDAQGGGRIVNIASVSSGVVNPAYAAYASSKAALAHLTRVLALEWGAAPGHRERHRSGTLTPLTEAYLAETGNRDTAMRHIPWAGSAIPRT